MKQQIKAALAVWYNLDNSEDIRWGAVEAFGRIIKGTSEDDLTELVTQGVLRVAIWTSQMDGRLTLKEVWTDRTGQVAVERQRLVIEAAPARRLRQLYPGARLAELIPVLQLAA